MQHKSVFRSLHTHRLGLGLALLLFAACTTQTTQVRNPHPTPPPNLLQQRYRIPSHGRIQISRGPQHAPIQIIEYLNPTHPDSRAIHHFRQSLWKQFPGAIRWEVRLAPTILQDQGYLYARAFLAAHQHNSFWPYLHRFFQRKTPPSHEELFDIAEKIGLSKQLFEIYLHYAPFKMWIDRDIRSLLAFTSPGTPALFINGAYISPPHNAERLALAAKQALHESRAVLEQGTPPHQVYAQITQNGS
ncbi:DsbA family protein, partial [Myxococcota bacterium]|nr:DsbA family protein [Myxococcota bacterium]